MVADTLQWLSYFTGIFAHTPHLEGALSLFHHSNHVDFSSVSFDGVCIYVKQLCHVNVFGNL